LVATPYPGPERVNTCAINRDSRVTGKLTAAAGKLASCKRKRHGGGRIRPGACLALHYDLPERHRSGFGDGFSHPRTQRDVRMHSAA
jgi:hypothetical protein